MKTTTLNIQGMTCDHCVKAVSEALENVEGVERALVELQAGIARVEYDDGRTDIDEMKAAVAEEGYTAEPAAA